MALLIGCMVLLMGFYNLEERHSLNKLKRSFTTVFEDRLMAESYIYELSGHLHRKQHILEKYNSDQTQAIPASQLLVHNTRIRDLVKEFSQTKLTKEESVVFSKLRQKLNILEQSEKKYMLESSAVSLSAMEANHEVAETLLSELSDIQVEVGKNINQSGNKILLGWAGSSQFEMAILVIFCLMMQAMIFTSGNAIPKLPQKAEWN